MRRLLPITAALFLLALADAPAVKAAWSWPLRGELITAYRNGEDPYAAGQHRGIDIAGPLGAPVSAATGGEVRFAGVAGSSGLTVSVRTHDGFDTSYLHLGAITVRAGERVSTGQRLGVVGSTGVRSVAAPHLHFGVRDAGSRHGYRDPLAFLPPPGVPAPESPPAAAPQPVPIPSPPAMVPAPRGVPSPARQPVRRPQPGARRLPLPRPEPSRRRVPVRTRPAPAVRRVPALPRTHAERRVPAPRADAPQPGRQAARPEPRQLGRPAPGHAPSAPVRSPAPPAAGAAPVSRAPASDDRGPDVGWALACVGLLLAAGILAFTGDGRGGQRADQGSTRREGQRGAVRLAAARIGAAIRPLLGRR